jgi:hypothetical protein
MTDKQQAIFFFLIVFFFTCGAGLLVYRQYNAYYEEKTANDLQVAVNLPVQKTPASIVLPDGRLQVNSPKEGDTVGQTFKVSGFAQGWFEATIAVKVFDDKNNLLYSGSAMASQDNYSQPSPFSGQVILTATSTTPAGRIEFNDYSAKDGSLVYQKVVYIKFADFTADTTGWKIYRNEEYGFEFQYPEIWVLEADKNGISLNSPENLKNEFRGTDIIIAFDKNPNNLSAKEYYDGNHGIAAFDNPSQDKEILIDNKKAYKLYPATGESAGELVIIPVGQIYIRFDTSSVNNTVGIVFEKILSTFKFIK